MESNKDRQYRTDHDRCWYTVKVKLARFWHTAPAPEILTLGEGFNTQVITQVPAYVRVSTR